MCDDCELFTPKNNCVQMRYSIVIPCYNEEENLPRLIETVRELAEGKDIEFILVENGSKDNSYEVMLSLTDGISYIKIVKVEVNQGLGYGIHQGILHAQGDYIGWIHADMQTPVSDIEKLFHYYYPILYFHNYHILNMVYKLLYHRILQIHYYKYYLI